MKAICCCLGHSLSQAGFMHHLSFALGIPSSLTVTEGELEDAAGLLRIF